MLRRFLTSRRLAYAWFAGAALWSAWLGSLVLGTGNLDLAGQPVGTDYLQFYAAGVAVRRGDSASLYDVEYQADLERDIIGPDLSSYHAFITPPFLSYLFVPLSQLPYTLSFAVWSVLGLALLFLSLNLLESPNPSKDFLWSMTWFPVFAAVAFGQNALVSVFIASLGYNLWRHDRKFLAGLALSLMAYKPQLLLGFAVWWALDLRGNWRAFLGLATGTGGLVALCFLLMPEASLAYVDFARNIMPDLPNWQEFPLWHLYTVRGFWRLLLPWWPRLGDVLTLALAGLGMWGFAQLARVHRERTDLLYAAAVVLSVWLTPHAMGYDWALLLVPAIVISKLCPHRRERWRVLYALVWLASFLSAPLAYLQLQVLPVAIQVSVPVLAFAVVRLYRDFIDVTLRGELWPTANVL